LLRIPNEFPRVFILICILAAHGIGLLNQPTWDDRYLLPKAKDATVLSALTDRSAGSSSPESSYYRPLRTLIIKTAYWLPGSEVVYLHAFSIFLHIVNCILVYQLCVLAGATQRISLFCALAFGLHPLTTESVAGISQSKELLATLFTLLSVLTFPRMRLNNEEGIQTAFGLALYTLFGLLSKETSLVIPLMMIALLILFRDRRRSVFTYGVLPACVISAAYLLVILVYLPGPERGSYVLDSLPITLYTTCGAFIKYVSLYIFPFGLSVRHDIPWITTFLDWRVLSTIFGLTVLFIAAVILLARRDDRAAYVVFFLISLLPFSNIIPVRGSLMSERYLYMPLAFFSLLLAASLPARLAEWRYRGVVAVLLLAPLAFGTFFRTREWKDDRTLFESARKIAPDSLVVHWKLFETYRKSGEAEKAAIEYREMKRINLNTVRSYVAYAKRLFFAGYSGKSEKIWDRAEYSASGDPALLRQVRLERDRFKRRPHFRETGSDPVS
jgi:hypothetical protein